MFTCRRDFLKTAASVLASTAALPAARAQGADSFIEVFADEPTATIAPEIYGHFAEHIGGVIYDGIWVGPDSKIPNVNGIRKDLLDRLKVIKPSGADALPIATTGRTASVLLRAAPRERTFGKSMEMQSG